MEIPSIQASQSLIDIYMTTLNYLIITEYIQSIKSIIDENLTTTTTTYNGLLYPQIFKKTFNYLLDTCCDEYYIEHLLRSLNTYLQIIIRTNRSVSIDYLSIICK